MNDSDENDNMKMGCAFTLIVVSNLILAITAIVHLSGFWRCTGALFTFMIGGSVGGMIGMGIGAAIAKIKDDDSTYLGVSACLLGALMGSNSANIVLGRWLFNLDFLRLIQ